MLSLLYFSLHCYLIILVNRINDAAASGSRRSMTRSLTAPGLDLSRLPTLEHGSCSLPALVRDSCSRSGQMGWWRGSLSQGDGEHPNGGACCSAGWHEHGSTLRWVSMERSEMETWSSGRTVGLEEGNNEPSRDRWPRRQRHGGGYGIRACISNPFCVFDWMKHVTDGG